MQAFHEHRDYSWRPARRLRHVTAVGLLNLYDPEAHGATAYHYDLRTWNSERSSWTPFYRSEQLPINHNLEWERQALDPESEVGLRGLQHLQNVGPLRLRVYAGAAQHAATSTPGRTAEACVTGSSGSYEPGAVCAAAAGTTGGSLPRPSDYEAQHQPHLRRADPCHRPGGGRGLQAQSSWATGHPGANAAPYPAPRAAAETSGDATRAGDGGGGGGGGGNALGDIGAHHRGDAILPLERFCAHMAQRVQPPLEERGATPAQPPWEAGAAEVPYGPGVAPAAQPMGSRSQMAGGGAGAVSRSAAGEEGGDLARGGRGDGGGDPRWVQARAAAPGASVIRDIVDRVFSRVCEQQQLQRQQYQQCLRQQERQQQGQQEQQQQQQREHRQVQVQVQQAQGLRATSGLVGRSAMQLDDVELGCQLDAGLQQAEQGCQHSRQRGKAAGADTPGSDDPEAVQGSGPGPDKYSAPYDSTLSSGSSSSTDCSSSSNLRSAGGNTSDWSATTRPPPPGHQHTDTGAATPAATSDGGPDSCSGAIMEAVTPPSEACARRGGHGRGPVEQGPGGSCPHACPPDVPPTKAATWGGSRDGVPAGVEVGDGAAQAWRPSTQSLQQLQFELPPQQQQQERQQQLGDVGLERNRDDVGLERNRDDAVAAFPWRGGAGMMRRSVAEGSAPREPPRHGFEVVKDGGAASAWPDGGSRVRGGYGGQADVTAGGGRVAGGPGAEGGEGREGVCALHDCWGARLVAEFVFELVDLVPLEPHMLLRTWPVNLPVLLMAPDRQPFTPLSALPPPPLPPSLPLPRTAGLVTGIGRPGQAGTRAAASVPSREAFLRGLQPGEGRNQSVGPVVRGSGSNAEGASGERAADEQLIRWLLGSGSIVQPLQAADSLDAELQDEVILAATAAGGGAEGGGRHRSSSAVCVAASASAASTSVLPPRHGQPRLSAANAAALLDPGPAPGFLPGALAVLFGQELPRASPLVAVGASATAGTGADAGVAQVQAQVQAHLGGPHHGAASQPAPEECPYPWAMRPHAALTGAAVTGAAAAAGGRRVASTPSLAAVGTTAGSLDVVSAGSVAAWASTPDLAAASAAAADPGAAGGHDLPHSAAASYDNLSRAGTHRAVCNHLSAPPSPTSSYLSSSLGPQQPLTAAAGIAATPSALSATPSAVSRGNSHTSLASLAPAAQPAAWRAGASSLPPPRPPCPPLMAAAAAVMAGHDAGLTGTAAIPGSALALQPQFQPHLQLQPGPQVLLAAGVGAGVGRDPSLAIAPVSDSTSPGLDPVPGGGLTAHQPYQHHHQRQPQQPSTHPCPLQHQVLSAPHGLPEGHAHRRHGQRMCDVLEVRASVRRLTQLQERLHGARVRALDMRQQLAAVASRRHQADERRARGETARAERDHWAHRAAQAGAQMEELRAAAGERRRVLRERALAIAHAAGVLKGAEVRRLSAEEQLEGPSGRGQLVGLTAALVGRRNRLVAELGRTFQIGPESEALLEPAPLDLTLDSSWAGSWAGDSFKQEPERGYRGQQQQQQPHQQQPGQGQAERQRSAVGAVGDPGGGRPAPAAGPTRLAVVGLELPPDLIQRSLQGPTSWSPLDLGRTYDADQRTAAGLGYLAEAVDLAATYLGVPLRYPIAPRVSVSYISDPVPPSAGIRAGSAAAAPLPQASPAPSAGSFAGVHIAPGGEWRLLSRATGAIGAAAAAATGAAAPSTPPPAVGLIPGPRGVGSAGRLAVFSSLLNASLDPRVAATPAGALGEDAHPPGLNPAAGLPLFWGDGARDRTRFAYAVYLLCKDVEQLLAAHGIPAVAPNQPLQNLYVLVTAAASGLPWRRGRGGVSGRHVGQVGFITAREAAGEEADSRGNGDGGGGADGGGGGGGGE